MICVSVMLAVFLGWPLAFGGSNHVTLETARAEAKTVVVEATASQARLIPAVAQSVPAATAQPESCYKRYQREIRQCSGVGNAACRLQSADHWDMCEATGFWPD